MKNLLLILNLVLATSLTSFAGLNYTVYSSGINLLEEVGNVAAIKKDPALYVSPSDYKVIAFKVIMSAQGVIKSYKVSGNKLKDRELAVLENQALGTNITISDIKVQRADGSSFTMPPINFSLISNKEYKELQRTIMASPVVRLALDNKNGIDQYAVNTKNMFLCTSCNIQHTIVSFNAQIMKADGTVLFEKTYDGNTISKTLETRVKQMNNGEYLVVNAKVKFNGQSTAINAKKLAYKYWKVDYGDD